MGRFGLPEGLYPQCKVKLAERPLAERTADVDNPGSEETIWIERLSPCHGSSAACYITTWASTTAISSSSMAHPLPIILTATLKVPVFPHLATLIRRNYQLFDFAGTQGEPRQLAGISIDLDEDTVVYPQSENFRLL